MREERQLVYFLLLFMFTLSVLSVPLRLLGGKHHYEGRIEVFYDGKWGEVCDHKWNLAGARVVCRMLGYPDAERYTFGDWWGKGSGYFWLDDVQCKGTEKNLVKCKRKDWGRCNCRRGETAGVICREPDEKRVIYPSPSNFSQGIVDLPVRLYGPLRRGYISQGVLQVQVGGRWGAVCSNGWTEFNSRVACGMLGYVDANKVDIKVKTVNSTTYLMSNVKCSGRESSLVECEHRGWGRLECKGGSHVTISCKRSNMLKHPSLRLRGSHRLWEGRVEVKSKNRRERLHWGTVCDDEFDLLDANVVCRTLGLGTASRVFTNAKFGQGSRSIYMDNVQCNGWEKAFSECSYKDKTDCTHYEDVSVRCNAPKPHLRKIRLVGGRNAMEGFVEMHDGSKWGAVCGEGWGIEEASVTCRQLDLGFGMRAVKGKYNFGLSSVKIQYSHLDCSLSEISLFHCSRSLPHKTRCKSLLRAGVVCTKVLPDLVVNVEELERHVRIDAIPLRYLRCSYEENCLGSSARRQWDHNQHYVRRLLRFTTRIENRGLASFVPDVPRARWQWHECHRHYHSMEVFSVYDLINTDGMKIAAGHKASFCLEDTVCDSGIHRYFNCTDGGPQGVSPNCYDVYKWNIDCQWIDVTDHPYGTFYLRVVVNPHRRVPESDYLNNIAKCKLSDYGHFAYASDCRLENCESGVDTHGGNSNGACCVFPFRYRGRLYRSCITTDLNRNWCATTRNFDRDKLYGICF